MGKEFNNADKGKTFKQGGDMKKMNMGGYSSGGAMPMKDGKPAFIGDGKGMKKGGMANGGSASKRADGVATKGKTKGTMIAMKYGGKAC